MVGIPVRPESEIRQEVEAVFEKIKKRDGRVEDFDSSKITAAIAQAGHVTGEFYEREAKKLTLRVLTLAHQLRPGPIPEVEEIQDIVERVLLDSPFYKTAKAYILYREQHARIRQIATKANVDLVNYYIDKMDWKIKENSNMSYSLQGLNNYISSKSPPNTGSTVFIPLKSGRPIKAGTSISMISASFPFIVSAGICRIYYDRGSGALKAR